MSKHIFYSWKKRKILQEACMAGALDPTAFTLSTTIAIASKFFGKSDECLETLKKQSHRYTLNEDHILSGGKHRAQFILIPVNNIEKFDDARNMKKPWAAFYK